MIDARFEFIANLQYKVKSLSARVNAFESGSKYVAMTKAFNARLAEKDREIRRLKIELANANAQTVTMRQNWSQVFDDMDKEHEKDMAKKDRELRAMEERAEKAEMRLDGAKAQLREKCQAMYQVLTELEDAKGKNQKLAAQINRDHENSSAPSSLKPNHKKITNNRVSTGRRPGGQPGHIGRPRKRHTPTKRIEIPAPERYANNPDYRPTGKTIARQLVGISVNVTVDEYTTPEYRHVRTGVRVHADFPEGVVNDVNYGGSVKAFAYLLNNNCNVSIEKVSDLIADITGGELRISAGMINGLSGEFALKIEDERNKAFSDIILSPVMNLDFTTIRVNGKNMNVLVCATPTAVMYFAREHKGHEGIKGTLAEYYMGIMVHDHDITFYSYGSGHQECLEHVLRYLKDSMDNEPDLKWNRQMRELIQEMIHFRNRIDPDDERNPDKIDYGKVMGFETRFDEILAGAQKEYEYDPPSKYYKEGYNLYKKLVKYKDNHLLFLHDRRVPPTNNLSERLLRIIKRKQKQAMTFRSFEGLDYLCRCMGTVALFRDQDENLFEAIAAIFNRPLGIGVRTSN